MNWIKASSSLPDYNGLVWVSVISSATSHPFTTISEYKYGEFFMVHSADEHQNVDGTFDFYDMGVTHWAKLDMPPGPDSA